MSTLEAGVPCCDERPFSFVNEVVTSHALAATEFSIRVIRRWTGTVPSRMVLDLDPKRLAIEVYKLVHACRTATCLVVNLSSLLSRVGAKNLRSSE